MFKQDQDIFKVLLKAVSEGVVIVDKHQSIVETNDSANQMFGYTKDELLKQSLNVLIPQNHQAKHSVYFKDFIKNQKRRQMGIGLDLIGTRKDGSTFPVEVGLNSFTLYEKNYVMALIVDITERIISEQEKNHLASIFHESLNEIYVFDAQTLKFINANYGAQKNIEYTLDELKNMTPVDIKLDFSEALFRKKIELLDKDNVEKIEFETMHRRKSGTTYPVNAHLQRSKLGNRDVYVAIILDITEQRNYTEKLEETVEKRTKELKLALSSERELNELKTKFLSLVSHEFKTPLSGILTSSMLLNKYKLTEQQDKRDKHIKTISDKVHYLNNILNDFLSLEKLDKGKIQYKFHTFKLSKVVNEVVYNANMLLKPGQYIKYPENIHDFSLYQDEKIVELAISNLVQNSIKYSHENARIEIDISQNETMTIIKVKDDGIGIPIEDQKYISNLYFRASNAIRTHGTGIGLNIVKDHLENLNGKIYFESIENKGSIFTIEIPNTAVQ